MPPFLFFIILIPILIFILVFIISRIVSLHKRWPDSLCEVRMHLQKEAGPLEEAVLPQNGPNIKRYFDEADRYTPGYTFPGTRIMGTVKTNGITAGVILLLPKQKPYKGTVIALHGYSDYSSYNLPALYSIAENGWAVLACDLPGHGFSGGYSGDINDFRHYGKYLADIIKWRETQTAYVLSKPVVLLGHSTGCAAIMELLWQSAPEVDRAVFLAPLLFKKGYKRLALSLKFLRIFLFAGPVIGKKERYLDFDAYPFTWIPELGRWMKQLDTKPPISLPILVIQGDNDKSLYWEKARAYMKEKFINAEMHILSGGGHVLFDNGETEKKCLELIVPYLNKSKPEL